MVTNVTVFCRHRANAKPTVGRNGRDTRCTAELCGDAALLRDVQHDPAIAQSPIKYIKCIFVSLCARGLSYPDLECSWYACAAATLLDLVD